MALSEQELHRREERQKLMGAGINPYPSETFEITTTTEDIHQHFAKSPEQFEQVRLAGRLMRRRIMGKASFAEIQDAAGRIQIYIARDEICPDEDKSLYNTVFKQLLDLGDIIGISGFVFTTKTGETTVHVKELKVLTKSLRPLPLPKDVQDEEGNTKTYDAFTDPEQRYRQRYVRSDCESAGAGNLSKAYQTS